MRKKTSTPRNELQCTFHCHHLAVGFQGATFARLWPGEGHHPYSNVHNDDFIDLYLLTMERAPGGSFVFAENGNNSFKDCGDDQQSTVLGGKTTSLPRADIISAHYGEAVRLGAGSRVARATACLESRDDQHAGALSD